MGLVVPWGGHDVPDGWLLADGQAVSRSTWKELFAVLGTTYGAGDGATTFGIPDLRGRFALGQSASGTGSTWAESLGSLDHVHQVSLAAHSHTVQIGPHSHDVGPLSAHSHGWFFTLELNANSGPSPVLLKSQTGQTQPSSEPSFPSAGDPGGPATTSQLSSEASIQPSNPPYLALRFLVLAKREAAVPCGVLWYGGSNVPTDAMPADGRTASRTSEAWLFGCLKTQFGTGDGSSTFALPDLRERSALGVAATGTGSHVGEQGGTLNHAHSAVFDAAPHVLSFPSHVHDATRPPHIHAVPAPAPQHSIAPGSVFGCVTGLDSQTGPSDPQTATSSASPPSLADVAPAPGGMTSTSSQDTPYLALHSFLHRSSSHRLPSGTIAAFAGKKIPFGWLVADGREVSREDFESLFDAIGTTFGPGDGATTFNLPDLRGRMALGLASAGPASQLGASGGSLDHTHLLAVPDHAHDVSFPSHTHSFAFGTHMHSLGHTQILANDDFASIESARGVTVQVTSDGTADAVSGPGSAPPATTSSDGGASVNCGSANPPVLVLRYVIHS